MPRQLGCGYQYLAYGDLKAARKVAEENAHCLTPYVKQGYDVVAMEPTGSHCLRPPVRVAGKHPLTGRYGGPTRADPYSRGKPDGAAAKLAPTTYS